MSQKARRNVGRFARFKSISVTCILCMFTNLFYKTVVTKLYVYLLYLQTRCVGSGLTSSMSSVQHQQPPCSSTSYQIPRPNDKRILFINPVEPLEFNFTGAEFVGFDEFRINIPPEAVHSGSTECL